MDVLSAILHRQAIRAFLPQTPTREQIEKILRTAQWAPSGVNTQPWRVTVLTGAARLALSTTVISAFEANHPPKPDYAYYPDAWIEPYRSRRKACGMALYSALEIAMGEEEKRQAAWRRNYLFFDAPVGFLFWIDAHLGKGSWVDLGFFIQSVALAARGLGLETCPQAAWAEYPDIIRAHLGVPEDCHLVCGMALGYADWDQAVNQYRTTRVPLREFVDFRE